MAIFVSTPTAAAPTPLTNEGQDPAVIASAEGFTEELAAAMLPGGDTPQSPTKLPSEGAEALEKKPSDLQILPAEVLKNAVGDANFALAAQVNAASVASTPSADTGSNPLATETEMEDLTSLDGANDLKAAEMAAANLAAQMSPTLAPSTAPAQVPENALSGVTAGAINAKAASAADSDFPQLSTLPSATQNLNLASLSTSVGQALQIDQAPSNSALSLPTQTTQANTPTQDTQISQALTTVQATALDASTQQALEKSASNGTALAQNQRIDVNVSNLGSALQTHSVSAENLSTTQFSSNSIALNTLPNAPTTSIRLDVQQTQVQSNGSVGSVNSAPNSAVDAANSPTISSEVEESAFKFDAKLSQTQIASTNNSASLTQSSAPASPSALTLGERDSKNTSNVNAATPAPQEPQTAAAQSLEDLSSSFVSSLVGGPQRPVHTVMDWISTQPQERPSPVVPHEVRLDSGAVQLEIQKMVKQGGGHVVMELTPPDQSKFTIELKLDDRGGALLVVEGVSDSTRTRLEQSAPQLREQFQQMGLELQLDMRQQNQSTSSSASNFSNSQDREGRAGQPNGQSKDLNNPLALREAGANRARVLGSNQVYLYA